jgi:hypothetical protein
MSRFGLALIGAAACGGEAARPAEMSTIAVGRVAAQPLGVLDAGAGQEPALSYEQALALATPVASDDPDLSNAELSAPMANGSFIRACGAPDDMKVTARVVVHSGRALGVSVTTSPPDATVVTCIDRHVRALAWPRSERFDSFTTAY